MELTNKSVAELEERKAAIIAELENTDADLDALEEEARAIKLELETRAAAAKAAEEQRAAIAENKEKVTIIEERKAITTMEVKNIITRESEEYRAAFLNVLRNTATAEERAIFADNTVYGDGAALPIGLDREIWDAIHTNHPVLEDVDAQRFGIAIKVTQATPAGVTGKKDSAAVSEMAVTFVDKTLVGKDYLAVVKLSYAEAKMSASAMENYIKKAVVEQVGDAMAADVFASMLADTPSANKITKSGTYFTAIGDALGAAKTATNAVIYANSKDYYAILKEVDANGQPIVRDGVVLGAEIKKDNAATKIVVVDPQDFVLDIIHEITLKVQDKVEEGCLVYGGYGRAEGCMRKVNSVAYIL